MLRLLIVGDQFMKPEIIRDHMKAHFGKPSSHLAFKLMQLSDMTLRERGEGRIREYAGSPEEIAQIEEQVRNTHVLVVHIAPVSERIINAGRQLRIIACSRGGPVNVDLQAATKREIPVIYTPGRNAEAVADFTIGLMLAESRNIARAHTLLKTEGIWKREFYHYDSTGSELAGKILGIIGFGAVGALVAVRAKAFGMKILAYDPFVAGMRISRMGARPVEQLDSLLERSDFVTVHARLTPETEKMINSQRLSHMKKTAFLINTSRGALVDENALYVALKSGTIRGAALDVFSQEPVPRDSPLLSLSNITVTPHIAGASVGVVHRASDMITEDIVRVLTNRRPKYCANPVVLKSSHRHRTRT
jgi:D-3-phosphoglycerate dehydrogenase